MIARGLAFSAALLLVLVNTLTANGKVYFEESFADGEKWTSRWVQSKFRSDYGAAKVVAGKFPKEKSAASHGLKLTEDARHYAVSAPFSETFETGAKPLVVQFSVKHEQNLDCGGAYIKLLPPGTDLAQFHGQEDETPYAVMFGPDVCGSSRRTHVIFHYKDENHLIKEPIPPPIDELSHLFTLTVWPNQTFDVLVDGDQKLNGNLSTYWDMLKPRTVKDPDAVKPDDWDEREYIADPEDVKPADWDDVPEYVPDADAAKPDDWDDDMDGDWEAPKVRNPEFKGKWAPKQIKNPDYQGLWVHPEIPNPEFEDDPHLHHFSLGAAGIEVWQVKSGSIFGHMLVTDDPDEAASRRAAFLEFAAVEKADKLASDAAAPPAAGPGGFGDLGAEAGDGAGDEDEVLEEDDEEEEDEVEEEL